MTKEGLSGYAEGVNLQQRFQKWQIRTVWVKWIQGIMHVGCLLADTHAYLVKKNGMLTMKSIIV